jgi:hypothetical protein
MARTPVADVAALSRSTSDKERGNCSFRSSVMSEVRHAVKSSDLVGCEQTTAVKLRLSQRQKLISFGAARGSVCAVAPGNVKAPREGPTKPIEQMTPLELENYRLFLEQEKQRISARLKDLLEERQQREGKSAPSS